MSPGRDSERAPLLQDRDDYSEEEETIDFDDGDEANPRNWPLHWKYIQTFQIFLIGFVCPMASSIFAPAMSEIAETFNTSRRVVVGAQTGFVMMLGIGPLFLAPMSETFGRRNIFLICLTVFTLMQIPTALAPNIESFIVVRSISGIFGSVGVANGGGTVADLFETKERAKVLGVYLVAPLLGPTIGPLIGGLIVGSTGWRWIFWTSMLLSGTVTIFCYFFLYETNAPTILQMRKQKLQKKNPDTKYKVEGQSDDSIPSKIAQNGTRAIKILTTQPIVTTMSIYQALIFSSMYTLYAQYGEIWNNPPYNFTKSQLGLTYIAPAVGFIVTAVFTVAFIDRVYDYFSKKNDTDGEPEYRLPMANVGAVLLPISLFWFGWSVEKQLSWPVPVIATVFFGASQVSIFNTVQTYYIDAFESNAASALAAGAFFRSMVGGVVPLFVSVMFDSLGYGLGMSVFGILSLLLMPAPLLFQTYGKRLREKYPFKG